jgi:hypothetical protein
MKTDRLFRYMAAARRFPRPLFVTLLSCALQFSLAVPALAQETPGGDASSPPPRSLWYIGISAGAFFGLHSGGFSFPAACADCGRYEDGAGIGPAFDLRVSIPLTTWLRIEPRIFGECRSGDFTSDPIATEIIGKDLKPQALLLEDELRYNLRLIGIDLLAAVPIGRSGIAVLAGPAVGFNISETATVTERIVSPAGVTFTDGSTSHDVYDGDATNARGTHAGVRAGISYTQPIGRDLALGCEATWLLPFGTVGEDDEWKTSGIRGLLSFLFAF